MNALERKPRFYDRRYENKKALLLIVLFLLAGYGYTHGVFDNFLWRVGLNYQPCATNGFGATFCGKDLDDYKQRIKQP
jgi:hypothetical protein